MHWRETVSSFGPSRPTRSYCDCAEMAVAAAQAVRSQLALAETLQVGLERSCC